MQQVRCSKSYHSFSRWSPTVNVSRRDLSFDCRALQLEINALRAKLRRQKDRFRRQQNKIKELSRELDKIKVQRHKTLHIKRDRGLRRKLMRERLKKCNSETLGTKTTASLVRKTARQKKGRHGAQLISNTKFRVKVQRMTGEEIPLEQDMKELLTSINKFNLMQS